jgi:hypothetical protein
MVGVAPALLALVVRWQLKEPESWKRANAEAQRLKQSKRSRGGRGADDEFHKQMGDLREIFRDRQLRYHVAIGMTLGICGQIGLWGIGYWTPELIRGSQAELRREAFAEGGKNGTRMPASAPMDLQRLPDREAGDQKTRVDVDANWRTSDDRLVAWGTVLQDTAGMCGIYAFTFLTARVGRRRAFALSYLLAFVATVFTFSSMRTPADVYWMAPILGFCISSVYGGFAIYFPELFPTRLRSTGTGLCYNAARYVTAFGPLLLGQLVGLFARTGADLPLRWAAVSLATIYLVGFVAVRFAPETHGKPLPE